MDLQAAQPQFKYGSVYRPLRPTTPLPAASATSAASAPVIGLPHGIAVPTLGVESGA